MTEPGTELSEEPVEGTEEDKAFSGRSGLIVIGSGPTGRGVVQRTSKVTPTVLVDKDLSDDEASTFPELEAVRVVRGDATSRLVLGEAGVETAYALVAATSEDETNLEACRLAVDAGVPEAVSYTHLTLPTKA